MGRKYIYSDRSNSKIKMFDKTKEIRYNTYRD